MGRLWDEAMERREEVDASIDCFVTVVGYDEFGKPVPCLRSPENSIYKGGVVVPACRRHTSRFDRVLIGPGAE